MRNCVTHHFACDCREDKFKKLEEENKKLREALEFYADRDNWWEGDDHEFTMIGKDSVWSKKDRVWIIGVHARKALEDE